MTLHHSKRMNLRITTITTITLSLSLMACVVGEGRDDPDQLLDDSIANLSEDGFDFAVEATEGFVPGRGLCLTPFFPPQLVIGNGLPSPDGFIHETWRFQGYSNPFESRVCPRACQTWPDGALRAGFRAAVIYRNRPIEATGQPPFGGSFPPGSKGWDCIIDTSR